MGYCLVISFYSNRVNILQKRFRANSDRLDLAIRELFSDFETRAFSKHSALYHRLIYRCFITLFHQVLWSVTLRVIAVIVMFNCYVATKHASNNFS